MSGVAMGVTKRLDSYFGIDAAGSTVGREVVGGLTTFSTMSYIIFVQPAVLSMAGMPFGSVLLATCFASASGCFLMGLLARYPFALAPGMGANFLFAFTVCGTMGFSWQSGLTLVFAAGALFVLLSFFAVRERLMDVLPASLKNSIGPAIGLFIAFIGLQWSGLVVLNPATMVQLAPLHHPLPLICAFSVLLIVALMARGVRSAILIGTLTTAGLGLVTGALTGPSEPLTLGFESFFELGLGEIQVRWADALLAVALLLFLDFFDTVGTLVGLSRQAGYLTAEGRLPRSRFAFLSDALATCIGSLFGTSTVTTYIESSTGVAAGARTGLASVVTGICFLAAIALAPIVRLAGENAGPGYYAGLGIEGAFVSMYPTVAPAMIVVGMLMLKPLQLVDWDDITEALPAFLTVVMMVFGYGITEGVAMGCISFAVVKTVTGRMREVHPIMAVVAVLLVLRYAFLT